MLFLKCKSTALMNQQHQNINSDRFKRVENGLDALRQGRGVLVADAFDRENEVDLIFSAESVTIEQMALLIRECSGIVCLCMTDEMVRSLDLPMMVENNTSGFQTAFTVSIEAAEGVTTGVSAADRVKTVRTAVANHALPADLRRPGHIFPLRARPGGVLERPGHTEATVDLMRLAGLKPCGVLCELTNPDGTMATIEEADGFSMRHGFPVLTIEDLIAWLLHKQSEGRVA
jgi:3,4-dihydroxy 2-butanone 4-phosphate synthase